MVRKRHTGTSATALWAALHERRKVALWIYTSSMLILALFDFSTDCSCECLCRMQSTS